RAGVRRGHVHGRAARPARGPQGPLPAAPDRHRHRRRGRGDPMTAAGTTEALAPATVAWGTTSPEDPGGREAKLARAEAAGRALGALVQDPGASTAMLHDELAGLADENYREGQHFVAPGLGLTHGVRLPYQAALRRGLAKATKQDRAST